MINVASSNGQLHNALFNLNIDIILMNLKYNV